MNSKHARRVGRRGERGSTILEFALVAPFLMIAFFWTTGLGIMLGRYIQTVQVCRDLAHIYVSGADFTQSANQNLAVQLAQGTGMTATGGNGVVIFSRAITVYQADCDAAGLSGSCNNLNQCVFTQRIVIGSASLRTSAYGTPTASLMNSQGNISANAYLTNTDSTVRTSALSAALIAAGQTTLIPQGNAVWITELYFPYPDVAYLGPSTSGGTYSRFIY